MSGTKSVVEVCGTKSVVKVCGDLLTRVLDHGSAAAWVWRVLHGLGAWSESMEDRQTVIKPSTVRYHPTGTNHLISCIHVGVARQCETIT